MIPSPGPLDMGGAASEASASPLLHQTENVSITFSDGPFLSHRVSDLEDKHREKASTHKGVVSDKGYSPYGARRKLRLSMGIEWIVARHGYERCGLLTITFGENLTDWAEAERRFSSFEKNVLSLHCNDWAMVVQQQKRGAIHYHLVVGLTKDIRTGTDIATIKDRSLPRFVRYGKGVVNENLRQYWKDICFRARGDGEWKGGGYGIGRIELLPFIKSPAAVAGYLASYLKVEAYCPPEYRRKKKVRFSRTITRWLRSNFQANTYGSYIWRKKLSLVAQDFGCSNLEELTGLFGPRWFYTLRECVRSCPLSIDRGFWERGLAERIFQRGGREGWLEEMRQGLEDGESKWLDYRAAKARAWGVLEEELQRHPFDAGWVVSEWEAPTEWQLQLLLMNQTAEV